MLTLWSVPDRTGAKIAGHRGFFLIDDGVDLNQALINYGLDFLRTKGYKKVQAPFFMKKEAMAKTAQLSVCCRSLGCSGKRCCADLMALTFPASHPLLSEQFDEELYKVRCSYLGYEAALLTPRRVSRSSTARTTSTSSPRRSSRSRACTWTSGSRTPRMTYRSSQSA